MTAKFVQVAVAPVAGQAAVAVVALDEAGQLWSRGIFDPVSESPPTAWKLLPDDRPPFLPSGSR